MKPGVFHHQHPLSYIGKEAALLFIISLAASSPVFNSSQMLPREHLLSVF